MKNNPNISEILFTIKKVKRKQIISFNFENEHLHLSTKGFIKTNTYQLVEEENNTLFEVSNHTFAKYHFELSKQGKTIASLKEKSFFNFKKFFFISTKDNKFDEKKIYIDNNNYENIRSSFFSIKKVSNNTFSLRSNKGSEIETIFVIATAFLIKTECSKFNSNTTDSC